MIVVGKRVAAIDTDLAFGETVGRIQSQKFHGGAAIPCNLDFFGFERLAVGDQGDFTRGVLRAKRRDGGQGADLPGVKDAARGVHILHCPVGDGLVRETVEVEFGAFREAKIAEAGGHG